MTIEGLLEAHLVDFVIGEAEVNGEKCVVIVADLSEGKCVSQEFKQPGQLAKFINQLIGTGIRTFGNDAMDAAFESSDDD